MRKFTPMLWALTLGMASTGVLALVPGRAHADGASAALLASTYYELSPIYASGGIVFPGGNDPIKASGVHVYERNGLGGKFISTAIVAMILAAGSSNTEYMGSTYGTDYRVDYYRVKSSEELAAEDAARARSVDAAADNEYQMDVQIYWPQEGYTTASGFSWAITPWTWGSPDSFVVELGFLWARISDDVCPSMADAAVMESCRYSNFGMPLRVSFPVTRFMLVDVQWDLNWLALAEDEHGISHSSPVRASLTLNPIDRLFARGGLVASSLATDKVGIVLEAGLRF
jgi:hypothetical protein